MVVFLSHVPHLQSSRGPKLLLQGEVPLLRDRRTNVRIPQTQDSAVKRIGGRLNGQVSLVQRGTGQRKRRVIALFLGSERWVNRQAKIGSGAFQVRGKCIRAAYHQVFPARGPGKAKPR